MKNAAIAAVILACVAWAMPAPAVIGTIDPVPSATLLVPYFEVDLLNPAGTTTLFSINNSSATAVLAHVTLWTDLSVPTLAFNVYLTGYDVQTINVRDIFLGNLPQTASDGQDPTDTISPQGARSQDVNFASCTGQLPPPALSPTLAIDLRAAHTGQAAATLFSGNCAGIAFGDSMARGYITVDTVNNCTTRLPSQAGYFGAGGTGDATNQNVLWGDVFWVNPSQNFAQGDLLVHIEASGTNPGVTTAGKYTFYGRYTTLPWDASDNREPLVTSFGTRFLNGGLFTGGTNLLVWRDSKTSQASFSCPATLGRPSWYPLNQAGYVIFDEQEHPVVPPIPPYWPPPPASTNIPFGAAAQRTKVGGVNLPVPYTFGWLYLNLNTTIAGNPNPPADPAAAQAWVVETHDANGQFSVGYSAVHLDSAMAANHFIP